MPPSLRIVTDTRVVAGDEHTIMYVRFAGNDRMLARHIEDAIVAAMPPAEPADRGCPYLCTPGAETAKDPYDRLPEAVHTLQAACRNMGACPYLDNPNVHCTVLDACEAMLTVAKARQHLGAKEEHALDTGAAVYLDWKTKRHLPVQACPPEQIEAEIAEKEKQRRGNPNGSGFAWTPEMRAFMNRCASFDEFVVRYPHEFPDAPRSRTALEHGWRRHRAEPERPAGEPARVDEDVSESTPEAATAPHAPEPAEGGEKKRRRSSWEDHPEQLAFLSECFNGPLSELLKVFRTRFPEPPRTDSAIRSKYYSLQNAKKTFKGAQSPAETAPGFVGDRVPTTQVHESAKTPAEEPTPEPTPKSILFDVGTSVAVRPLGNRSGTVVGIDGTRRRVKFDDNGGQRLCDLRDLVEGAVQ